MEPAFIGANIFVGTVAIQASSVAHVSPDASVEFIDDVGNILIDDEGNQLIAPE